MLNIDLDKFRQVFGVTCENPNSAQTETTDALYMIGMLYEFPQEDLVKAIGFICAGFSEYYPETVAQSSEAFEFFTFLYAEVLSFSEGKQQQNLINLMTQLQLQYLVLWLEKASMCESFHLYIDEIKHCIDVLSGISP